MGLLELLPKDHSRTGWPWTEETDPLIYSIESIWPKISIITPSFNQGEFIEETIRSVILQNYPNLEFILIDGGSTDNSIQIIKKYEKQISYWVTEKDAGQSDAINKGLAKSTGEIFNWLNSDDYYSKNGLFNIARAFMKSDVRVVAGYNNRFIEKQREYQTTSKVRLELCSELEQTLFFLSYRQSSTFFKLEYIKALNGLKTHLHYVMDTEMFLRYLLKFGQTKIKHIDDIIVNYRLQPNSKTVSSQVKFKMEMSEVYNALGKSIINKKHRISTYAGYDISLIDYKKALSYYFALKTLNTSRKNILAYIKLLFSSYVNYPRLPYSHIAFLLQNILFYKKKYSDFE